MIALDVWFVHMTFMYFFYSYANMSYEFYFPICPICSRDLYVTFEQHTMVSNTLRQKLSRAKKLWSLAIFGTNLAEKSFANG